MGPVSLELQAGHLDDQVDGLRFTELSSCAGFRDHFGQPACSVGEIGCREGMNLHTRPPSTWAAGPRMDSRSSAGFLSSAQGGVTQHCILEGTAQPRGLFGSAGLHATGLTFLHYILFKPPCIEKLSSIPVGCDHFFPECQIFSLLRNWQRTPWVSPLLTY